MKSLGSFDKEEVDEILKSHEIIQQFITVSNTIIASNH